VLQECLDTYRHGVDYRSDDYLQEYLDSRQDSVDDRGDDYDYQHDIGNEQVFHPNAPISFL